MNKRNITYLEEIASLAGGLEALRWQLLKVPANSSKARKLCRDIDLREADLEALKRYVARRMDSWRHRIKELEKERESLRHPNW